MNDTIITGIIGAICTVSASILTFFRTKKKYNLETDAQQIQNVKNSFELYKDITEAAIKKQEEKISSLTEEVRQLTAENTLLKSQLHDVQLQIADLIGEIDFKKRKASSKKKTNIKK